MFAMHGMTSPGLFHHLKFLFFQNRTASLLAPVPLARLLVDDVPPLRDVDSVQELPDILVPHAADLLDVGCGLGHVLQTVA